MCGNKFDCPVSKVLGMELVASICDACSRTYEDARNAEIREQYMRGRTERLRAAFAKACPSGMFTCDLVKLPCSKVKYQEIFAFGFPGGKGLVVHGVKGTGKTRAMWQLAKRLVFDEAQQVTVLRDVELGRRIERSYEEHGAGHDRLIAALSRVPFLFVDDLGKAKLTPRVESDLFDIIDSRYANELPTVYTTQFTGDSLIKRFGCLETGEAILRRLRESCVSIHLAATKEVAK